MATKVYGVLCVGQSNQEPLGDLTSGIGYFSLVPEVDYRALTPDPAVSVHYGWAAENIKFLTFYNPEQVSTYPVGTPPPPFLDYEHYCQWLPWTHNEGPDDLNLNAVGFRYPNNYHRPLGPLRDTGVPQGTRAYGGGLVNLAVDIGVRFHGLLGTPIHMINSSVAGVTLHHKEPVNANVPAQWGWFDARRHNNWSPGDPDSLFARLLVELDSAKLAAEVDDVELDIVLVHVSQGEAESLLTNLSAHEEVATLVPEFVTAIRNAIYARGLCSTAPHYLPVIWEKLSDLPATYDITGLNDAIDLLTKDDTSFGTYSTDGFAKGDPFHYSVVGIRSRGAATLAEFKRIRSNPFVSMSLDDVPTLVEMRQMVRLEAERNSASLDQNDEVIDKAINDTLDLLYQTAGDSAWWLRHSIQVSLPGNYTEPFELPRRVTRLLEIRPHADRRNVIEFSMLDQVDNGRTRIMVNSQFTGMVDLHCIYEPRRLISGGERPVVPRQYINAVIAGAAWRVLHQSGNAQLEVKMQHTATILMERVSGHIGKFDRQRGTKLFGNRGSAKANFSGPTWTRRLRG